VLRPSRWRDRSGRRHRGEIVDRLDALAADAEVGTAPGSSGAVVEGAAGNQDVEHGVLRFNGYLPNLPIWGLAGKGSGVSIDPVSGSVDNEPQSTRPASAQHGVKVSYLLIL